MTTLFETNWDGFRLLLFSGDGIAEHIRSGKSWEPHFTEIVSRVVPKGSNVCDAGANFGIHTLFLARHVGATGKVYAFEPQQTIFQQLCFHLFLNNIHNVVAYPCALGERFGRTNIGTFSELHRANLGATPVGFGSHPVDLFPLDHFVTESLSFLKIDVQGCELFLLKGALKAIERSRPILFLEIEEIWLRRLQTSSKELIEYLFSQGYTLMRLDTEYPCDHLCVPSDRLAEIEVLLHGMRYAWTTLRGNGINLEFDDKPYYTRFEVF